MQIIFTDRNPDVIKSLNNYFSDLPDFGFYCGDIFHAYAQAFASPGNGFGIMTGGIDLVFRNYFGIALQDAIQHEIFFTKGKMYLPVGDTVVLDLRKFCACRGYPYFIYAPTMHLPKDISGTKNIENCFYAILSAIKHRIPAGLVVAVPGLGTLSTGMDPDESAKQMRDAYNLFTRSHVD